MEEWCRERKNHQFEFNKVKDTLRLTSRYQKMQNIDSIKAKRKVKKQIPEFNPNMSFIQVWQKLAAILLLPLLTGGILLYFFSGHHSEMNNYREITTSYGTRTKIDLPDGSHVWLNSGSTIRFPDKFAKDQRVVKIEGEALFDIITDKNRPFYVDLGELSVKATGTTFNVAAYPEENITPLLLATLAKEKDTVSLEIIKEGIYGLATGMANISNTLGITNFIIGGGISNAWDVFENILKESLIKQIFDAEDRNIHVVKANLAVKAGIIGSAKFALDMKNN